MTRSEDDGPGVPEAIPRTLQGVTDELGARSLDRLWIFPPRIKGRRESGLVVVSRFAADGNPERRRLVTASYTAERTGRGLAVEWSLSEEGAAPPGRLPPIMEGVVRRAGDGASAPREVTVAGDPHALLALFEEWDAGLLDPEAWPAAAAATQPEGSSPAAGAGPGGGPGPDGEPGAESRPRASEEVVA